MNDERLAAPLVVHREAISDACRRFGVERLEVFGSAADGRFDVARSDVDFIVRLAKDAAPGQGSLGRRFVALADTLEGVLGHRVDLMSDKVIDNPYLRRAVEASRTVIYDRAHEQAPA